MQDRGQVGTVPSYEAATLLCDLILTAFKQSHVYRSSASGPRHIIWGDRIQPTTENKWRSTVFIFTFQNYFQFKDGHHYLQNQALNMWRSCESMSFF